MHVLSQKTKRLDVSLSTEVSSSKLGNAMGMYAKEQKLQAHLAQDIKSQRLQIEKIKQVLHTRAWGDILYIFSPSLPPSLPLPTPGLLVLLSLPPPPLLLSLNDLRSDDCFSDAAHDSFHICRPQRYLSVCLVSLSSCVYACVHTNT